MLLSGNLKFLSSLISPLYVVGGATRDDILGYNLHDIDLSSNLKPEKIIELLASTRFKVKANSLKLGTLSISIDNESYEYTTMREDSYPCDGSHKPIGIKFTSDIYKDARRRDFTVNAIYYDIENETFIDPLGGIGDLENRLIKSTRKASTVFKEDALRILRMVRIAAENDFKIEDTTYEAAKKNAHLIDALAEERIQDEFTKILFADKKNNIKNAHYNGLKLLVECGAMAYIIPELLDGIGFAQNPAYHKYNVYDHIMHTISNADASVRLAALFHDIAKPYCQKTYGKMAYHDKYSAEFARTIMSRLKFKISLIEETERLVQSHMFDLKGDAKPSTVRRFIQKNYDILDKILALKTADAKASKFDKSIPVSVIRIKDELAFMQEHGIPLTIKDLHVDGNDALSVGLKGKQIGEALKRILNNTTSDFSLLNREHQLKFLSDFKG